MTDTADTATTDTTSDDTTTTDTGAEDTTDWQKEAEKFKSLARKHEERAKANASAAKELDEFKRQGMSEMEAAVDKARSDGRAEATQQFGSRLAAEAVRAAATGRVADVDALIEGIDPAKFLGEDGEPDRAAISTWMDRVAPEGEEDDTLVKTLDLAQGNRGTGKSTVDPLEQALTAITRR